MARHCDSQCCDRSQCLCEVSKSYLANSDGQHARLLGEQIADAVYTGDGGSSGIKQIGVQDTSQTHWNILHADAGYVRNTKRNSDEVRPVANV